MTSDHDPFTPPVPEPSTPPQAAPPSLPPPAARRPFLIRAGGAIAAVALVAFGGGYAVSQVTNRPADAATRGHDRFGPDGPDGPDGGGPGLGPAPGPGMGEAPDDGAQGDGATGSGASGGPST